MKHIVNIIISLALLMATSLSVANLKAQNDVLIGQYIHNRYAINPAFAGCREGLSLFAGFRKQWAGIQTSPMSIIFTANAPMIQNNIVVGLNVYSQTIREASNTGLQGTIGYRVNLSKHTYLSFALQPGVSIRNRKWSNVILHDEDDDVFAENFTNASPLLGVGLAIYSGKFFVGANVVSLFVDDDFDSTNKSIGKRFRPGDATYLATTGIRFGKTAGITVQPSVLLQMQRKYKLQQTVVETDDIENPTATVYETKGSGYNKRLDLTLTTAYKSMIGLELAYRTSKEALAGVYYQVNPQLRIAYNYEKSFGKIGAYNSGSHEISVQYDFVYRARNVSPRFF